MAEKRKATIKRTKNFIVEDFRNPPKKLILRWRSKKLPSGHVLTIAVLRRKGPRGGRTVVTAIKHPKTEKDAPRAAQGAVITSFERLARGYDQAYARHS